jgi:hypothetical protein
VSEYSERVQRQRKRIAHLDGNVHFGEIGQGPIDDFFYIVLAQVLGHCLDFLEFSVLVRNETILRKVPGEFLGNPGSELFFLFGKIAACASQ